MKVNFIEELKWRNMLQDIMPNTEQQLNKEMTKGYIGFDPTADSLGIGNLVQIMTLLHFQKAGHKPIALVGGATGMVGDPSGKSAERNLLSQDTLLYNQACQLKQLEKFLDFNCGTTSAEVVNNFTWFRDLNFLDFIRDIGKHITVNYMMAKDSVKSRLESGMSFTEFSYQLIQGYDFYYLNKNEGVKLQMGGSDQWGNMLTGLELIRKKDGASAFALTTPLIKKADGTKFGKTESGNIWLDNKKTSAYKFYQFWLNSSDEDVKNYIRIFTLKSKDEIESLDLKHLTNPDSRLLQHSLAEDITTRVHSKDALDKAKYVSTTLFGNSNTEELRKLSEQDLEDIATEMPHTTMPIQDLTSMDITTLLLECGLVPSKSQARRLLQQNGIRVNKELMTNQDKVLTVEDLLHNKYVVIQKGKKDYHLIIVSR